MGKYVFADKIPIHHDFEKMTTHHQIEMICDKLKIHHPKIFSEFQDKKLSLRIFIEKDKPSSSPYIRIFYKNKLIEKHYLDFVSKVIFRFYLSPEKQFKIDYYEALKPMTLTKYLTYSS